MPQSTSNSSGPLRRLAHLVYDVSGLADPPVISGLLDLEDQYRHRTRP